MIIGTIIVFRQVKFAKDRPVGYYQTGLFMMQMHTNSIYDHFSAFRNDLLSSGAVSEVAESVSPVTESWPQNGGLTWTDHNRSIPSDPDFTMKGVTTEYAKTLGLKISEGRDFRSGPQGSDSGTMILNEATVHYMGLKNPVGTTINWMKFHFTVIGVVKNMVMESPYEIPVPAMYYLSRWRMNHITVRINPRTQCPGSFPADQSGVGKIRSCVKLLILNSLMRNMGRGSGTNYASVNYPDFLPCWPFLFPASDCLASLPLSPNNALEKSGYGKCWEHTVFNLWKMLSKDFVFLVSLSCLIAIPIAWWMLHNWLNRICLPDGNLLVDICSSGIGAILITLATVSYQSVKAALTNPVKSLRSE